VDSNSLGSYYNKHCRNGDVSSQDVQSALEGSFEHDARPQGVNEDEAQAGLDHLNSLYAAHGQISKSGFVDGLTEYARDNL